MCYNIQTFVIKMHNAPVVCCVNKCLNKGALWGKSWAWCCVESCETLTNSWYLLTNVTFLWDSLKWFYLVINLKRLLLLSFHNRVLIYKLEYHFLAFSFSLIPEPPSCLSGEERALPHALPSRPPHVVGQSQDERLHIPGQ